jgi:hypothetical protein
MDTGLRFTQLNHNWNANPNVATPEVEPDGEDIVVSFLLNPFQFEQFARDDIGVLRFRNCSRYRIDPTNDHAWFSGQCRYSKLAPAWGEFYELSGDDPTLVDIRDWIVVANETESSRHFLFYFRDEMFECFAESWEFERIESNALLRLNL